MKYCDQHCASYKRMPNIAAALRHQRNMLGYRQKDVADKIGVKSSNIVAMWEKGEALVPYERAPDLAMALEMDVPWFVHQLLKERLPACAAYLAPA